MNTLLDSYRSACDLWSDIQANIPRLEQTIADIDAKHVIELGVRWGTSTAVLLYALRDRGELWSVDVNWPTGDLIPALSRQCHWHFIHGSDTHPTTLAALPDKADVVFVDTDHAFDHTLEELELYWPRVRDGGALLVHDTELEQPELVGPQPPFPVKRAVEEFCAFYRLQFENDSTGYGLGMITQ